MTRLLWLTDPHLDRAGSGATDLLLEEIAGARPDMLLLTGDISNSGRLEADLRRIAAAADCPTCFVLGNHDHYGSSIASIRDRVISLAGTDPAIRWLPPAGVVDLGDGCALIGVDGWADGRVGDPLATPLVLNDDRLIAELAGQDTRRGRLAVRRVLADADAARLAVLIDRAAERGFHRIVAATHVPPFVQALRPGSRAAHPHWHPLLVSGATGSVLREKASAHPEISFRVLAGHSHEPHHHRLAANLAVSVGAARYGEPALGLASVDPAGAEPGITPFPSRGRTG